MMLISDVDFPTMFGLVCFWNFWPICTFLMRKLTESNILIRSISIMIILNFKTAECFTGITFDALKARLNIYNFFRPASIYWKAEVKVMLLCSKISKETWRHGWNGNGHQLQRNGGGGNVKGTIKEVNCKWKRTCCISYSHLAGSQWFDTKFSN